MRGRCLDTASLTCLMASRDMMAVSDNLSQNWQCSVMVRVSEFVKRFRGGRKLYDVCAVLRVN